ncbi:hypothetical protein WJX81_003229 [Elliptochloris bilobata]|uniref:cGMP-dependent protein kinase n=1 Tax=Elliptochloris bilobata TaxID=381761 RepID=A0AAW1S113_9CHLO
MLRSQGSSGTCTSSARTARGSTASTSSDAKAQGKPAYVAGGSSRGTTGSWRSGSDARRRQGKDSSCASGSGGGSSIPECSSSGRASPSADSEDEGDTGDWDHFTDKGAGDGSSSRSASVGGGTSARSGAKLGAARRPRERSLFGIAEKRAPAPLRETASLKLAKLRGVTFVNQYVVIKYLGKGANGRVFLCLDMCDTRLYAVKIVKKGDPDTGAAGARRRRNALSDLRREVAIMRTLRHRNIVTLQEVVDDPDGSKMLLVMDYMEGGPVLTREALERGRRIPEPLALQYFRDMCKALDYLHFNKVVHGDLKPENVLMSARGAVTLSDFGCSKVLNGPDEYLERCQGTPAFLAPEMMRPHSRYRGRPTDVYALGACLFTFVYGRIPFSAPSVYQLFQVVQTEPLRFPEDMAASAELKDLLSRMLCKNPRERITLGRVMRHAWVTRRGAWPLRTVREMVRAGLTPAEGDAADTPRPLEALGKPLPQAALPDMLSTINVLDVPRQDHLLEVLRPGLAERCYADGEALLRQGEHGTQLLYIVEGTVDVLLKLAPIVGDELPPALLEGASRARETTAALARGPREYLVAVRRAGQFVGEMAAFASAAQRCASVIAHGPVRALMVPGEALRACVERVPEARQQIKEMVWMKASENMMLEALSRLAGLHRPLEELLREAPPGGAAAAAPLLHRGNALLEPLATAAQEADVGPTGSDAAARTTPEAVAADVAAAEGAAGPAHGLAQGICAGQVISSSLAGGWVRDGLPVPSAQAFSFGSQLAGSASLLEAAAQLAAEEVSTTFRRTPSARKAPVAMASSRAALLLAAVALLATSALAQRTVCDGLAEYPRPRPEAPNWSNHIAQLKSEVVAADQPGQGYELLFYGASIFENWRGTAVGVTWRNSQGIVEFYNNTFPDRYHCDVLACSGDDEGNLLWRLQNGELYQRNPPKVVVLELTGNNDLSDADCRFSKDDIDAAVPGTIQRNKEVVSLLRWGGRNSVRVVLLLITPRGGAYWAHPEEGLASFWPNRYTDAINRVNDGLRELAANDPFVTTQDCGYIWLNSTGLRTPDMVTDGMHPTLLGTQELTRCVARAVDPLMAAQGTPEPWRDSGLERVYQGLPFWVNSSAAYSSPAPANSAQVARSNSMASATDELYGAGPAPAPGPSYDSLRLRYMA